MGKTPILRERDERGGYIVPYPAKGRCGECARLQAEIEGLRLEVRRQVAEVEALLIQNDRLTSEAERFFRQ